MIRVLIKIFKGLVAFFRLVKMVITYTPKMIVYAFQSLKTLFRFATLLPSGITALAIFALALGILFLILRR